MAAYMIVDNEVTDPEQRAFGNIRNVSVQPSSPMEEHSLSEGERMRILEGDWHLHRLILLEFPSVEQARRWYQSDEYAPVKDIRLKTALTQVILVQGNS